jgi:hypothetical protein
MHVTLSRSGTPVTTFGDLLEKYGPTEFDSPFRSTVALLSYWRHAETRLPEFASALGAPLGDSAELEFEYQVPVQRGRGKPSCTDLMIQSADAAVAIEAKSTEPRYENVRTWLRGESEGNRTAVLDGWLELLSSMAAAPLTRQQVETLPYQLVHRAASACQPKAKGRWLVYHLFSASRDTANEYQADLWTLRTLLGSAPLEIRLVWSERRPTPRFAELSARWRSGEHNLRAPVKAGLEAGDLFVGWGTEELPLGPSGG